MPMSGSRPKTPLSPQGNNTVVNRSTSAARKRRLSENFYEEGETEDVIGSNEISTEQNDQIKKFHTRQSKKLPHWAWRILVTILGIKQPDGGRILVGQLMLGVTLVFAGVFAASFIWYTVYDIYSEYTKSNALTGTVSIMLVLFWCALGIYANRLLRNLFKSRKLVESVRLHSKTVFKVSASFLLIVLGVAITVINNLSAQSSYSDKHCRNISLSVYVCRTIVGSRIGYSVTSLVWNLVVGFVVLSVCRTHTIGIRRFIRELEEDGRLYEALFRQEIIDQLHKSGDFEASGRQSGYSTLGESSDREEEDHWAEDDPLVDDLTFYPRPSSASLATLTSVSTARSHWALARRRLLRQDSISSVSAAVKFRPNWRLSSTSSLNRSARSSRPNSGGSSQEEDVFPCPPCQQVARSNPFDRPTLTQQMETLVEQSTETLNTTGEDTPLRRSDIPNKVVLEKSASNMVSYGALGESTKLSSVLKDDNSQHQGNVLLQQKSSSRPSASQNAEVYVNKHSTAVEQELKSIFNLEMNGVNENHYGNGSDDDRTALLTSSDGERKSARTKTKVKKVKEKKKSREKKTHPQSTPKQEVTDDKVTSSAKGQSIVDGREKRANDLLQCSVSDCGSSHSDGEACAQPDTSWSWQEDRLLLTNEEIFLAHWKISCRLRSTSLALQRWLFMWITMILLWSAAFLVELVSHDTRILEIAQFILTILLIPLICSAYGEINYEGQRMIKSICPIPSRINMLKLLVNLPLEMTCICPTPDRVDLLFILSRVHLEMTAFGFAVNYSTIVTTIGALGLAFFTKLLLDDIHW